MFSLPGRARLCRIGVPLVDRPAFRSPAYASSSIRENPHAMQEAFSSVAGNSNLPPKIYPTLFVHLDNDMRYKENATH
jgi:hypothetical protein